MRKYIRRVGICLLLAMLVWTAGVFADKQTLQKELVRLHVVANSDSPEDQALKLRVRDAVVESLREELENLADVEAAKAYLRENLPKIEEAANRALREAGCGDVAVVSLAVQEFATRVYDTFTLPAGIYESLRITIGAGAGRNWWCVVFPSLCIPATSEGFEETASCAGFSDVLTGTLEGDYEIRFFILDAMGRLENFLHRG